MRVEYYDGSRYDGTMLNGYFHGQGTYIDSWGVTYSGEWAQGRRCGHGTITPQGVANAGFMIIEWAEF